MLGAVRACELKSEVVRNMHVTASLRSNPSSCSGRIRCSWSTVTSRAPLHSAPQTSHDVASNPGSAPR